MDDVEIAVGLAAVAALPAVVLAAMTGVGSRRRGAGWLVTVVSAALFPVTWVVWYVRDGVPARTFRRRTRSV